MMEQANGNEKKEGRPLCQTLPRILGHPIMQVFLTLSQRAQLLGLGLHVGWAMADGCAHFLEQAILGKARKASDALADTTSDEDSLNMKVSTDIFFLVIGMGVVRVFKQFASLWMSCCLLTDLLQGTESPAQYKVCSAIAFGVATGYSKLHDKSIAHVAWKLQGIGNLWLSCLLGSHVLLADKKRAKKTHFLWWLSVPSLIWQLWWIRSNDCAIPPFYGTGWIVGVLSKVEGCFKWLAPDPRAAYASTSSIALVAKMQDKVDNAIDAGLHTVNAKEIETHVSSTVSEINSLADGLGQKVDSVVKATCAVCLGGTCVEDCVHKGN